MKGPVVVTATSWPSKLRRPSIGWQRAVSRAGSARSRLYPTRPSPLPPAPRGWTTTRPGVPIAWLSFAGAATNQASAFLRIAGQACYSSMESRR